MTRKILIVDDDIQIRSVLRTILEEYGYEISEAENGAELKKLLDSSAPDIVLLDLKLQDSDGLELLPLIKRSWLQTEVIILTGYGTIDLAVLATKLGAYDFLQKPFDPKRLVHSVERALEYRALTQETNNLRQALYSLGGVNSPVFVSPAMKSVIKMVERIAPSDVTVLITGESGTGKEVIADLICALSHRANGPYIKINCAALPRELIESELFGSVKGAYTGAHTNREGLFKQAEGGTILLDEIAEMPVETQSKLLRVLQDKEVRPVGGTNSYKIDCRIIASTNRPIQESIVKGKLREDLYYRISTVTIEVPPLRERKEDIMPMANLFLKRYAAQAGRAFKGFTKDAERLLLSYDWPGNVRQLQNEIQRAVLLADKYVIEEKDLLTTAPNVRTVEEVQGLTMLEALERNAIIQALRECKGNKNEAARMLGIGRQTLYNKLKAYSIDFEW